MVARGNAKRQKVEGNLSEATKFTSGREIHLAFRDARNVSEDAVRALRNQLTVWVSDGQLSSDDTRIVLVRDWLEISPGAEDLFEYSNTNITPAASAMCLSALSSVLALTSLHLDNHAAGMQVLRKLLSPRWVQRLQTLLSGSHADSMLATLKLLNSISSFASGRERKTLLEAFSWDLKVFHKLLVMRRKGKAKKEDMLQKPDIRTLCLTLILSFIRRDSTTPTKVAFLDQRRDLFLSIFKGVSGDPYPVVRHVLEEIWVNIWQDPKLKRTIKVGLFGETTIQHLLRLYERDTPDEPESEMIPADLVHHFMLGIATHRGVGVCFADNGWYPRSSEDGRGQGESERERQPHKGGRIYNKILSNVLKMLRVNEDPRQQELALKILVACPELVAGYLPSSGITLEPRLSSRWLVNVAFLGSAISLPVPFDSFYLPVLSNVASTSSQARQFKPNPPPLATLVENILPSMCLKTHLSKGLQSNSALVQHATAVTLAKCLQKCEAVLNALRKVHVALEEDEFNGQWSKCHQELQNEVRKRLPDFQVIIAFSQQKGTVDAAIEGSASSKKGLLAEVGQRLLWLYHRCVPAMVAEVNFEVGKSLQGLWRKEDPRLFEGDRTGLSVVQQLLVLRMLGESAQFSWSAKPGGHVAPSNIAILLSLFAQTEERALKNAVQSLLEQTVASGPLFQHDPSELRLWLDALPTSLRTTGTEVPDGAPLMSEIDSVVGFLEDAFQRCSKNVYRYLEDLDNFASVSDDGSNDRKASLGRNSVSPLIMTVMEQCSMKARNGSLSPSDLLALATYIRKLAVKLLGTQENLRVVKGLSDEFTKNICDHGLCESSPITKAAIRREANILRLCISQPSDVGGSEDLSILASTDVEAQQQFLSEIEKVPIPDKESQRIITAFELVDWLRLVDRDVRVDELKRLVKAIHLRFPPALSEVLYHIPPRTDAFWSLLSEKSHVDLVPWIDFDWLLVHACHESVLDDRRKNLLHRCLEQRAHSHSDYKRYLGYIFLTVDLKVDHPRCTDWLEIVKPLLESAKTALSEEHFRGLKVFLVQENSNSNSLLRNTSLPNSLSNALDAIVDELLDPLNDLDREIVSPICSYWADVLEQILSSGQSQNISCAFVWLKFLSSDRTLALTTRCAQVLTANFSNLDFVQLLDKLLSVTTHLKSGPSLEWSSQHLNTLIRLRSAHSLTNIDRLLAQVINGGLPYGQSGFADAHVEGDFASILKRAQTCWTSRPLVVDDSIDLRPLFSIPGDSFSHDVSLIFEGLIYRSRKTHSLFLGWLKENSAHWASRHICRPLHAYLDTLDEDQSTDLSESDEVVAEVCSHVVRQALEDVSGDYHLLSFSCARLFLLRSRFKKRSFAKSLGSIIDSLNVNNLHKGVVRLGASLDKRIYTEFPSLSKSIATHVLGGWVRHLSVVGDLETEDEHLLKLTCQLLRNVDQIPSDVAETTIAAVTQHHISSTAAMDLANAAFRSTSLKPVTVNRLLQSIVQHAHLQKVCASGRPAGPRESVLLLLSALFHAFPENSCQPSHVQPLVQLYGGTWSPSDRRILAIFRLFESQGKGSVTSLLAAWSPSMGSSPSQKFLDCIMSLDPARVFRTCLDFPLCRVYHDRGDLDAEGVTEVDSDSSEVYDPLFLIVLFCHGLLEGPPDTALSWVQLFRSNIVSLIIRSLSSPDDDLRRLALAQMRMLWKTIEFSPMQEKHQVVYVLGLLRNLYQSNPEDDSTAITHRLPSFITLLLAHAMRAIFYPSNFIYPLTSRFLLQRPEIDPTDVPMLYGMLFSSTDDWKRERAWILRFLSDGMLSSEDWRVLKRRHTWDLLASLFQRSVEDKQLRRSVLDVLASLTRNRQSATSLVLKLSLIQWMEIQMMSLNSDEAVAWVKIVENIAVAVDQEKMDQVTRRSWRTGLLMCLNRLTQEADLDLLMVIARTTLRLSLSNVQDTRNVHAIVERALERLIDCEPSLPVPLSREIDEARLASTAHGAPHGRGDLFEIGGHNFTSIDTWGATVEMLWSMTMVADSISEAWKALTSRLLVWRTMNHGSVAGEWARREVVRGVLDRRPRSAGL